jgi:hypothetical protein
MGFASLYPSYGNQRDQYLFLSPLTVSRSGIISPPFGSVRGVSRDVVKRSWMRRLRAGEDVPLALGWLEVTVRAHYGALPLARLDAVRVKAEKSVG